MSRKCSKFIHFYKALSVCFTFVVSICSSFGHESTIPFRAPANYVPDDELIVVPVIIEKNPYDRFNERHKERFSNARQQLEFWMLQREFSERYGFEGTGVIQEPTEAQKERFLQRNYLRFIQRDMQDTTNQLSQNLVEQWTVEDEIDAIDEVEERNEVVDQIKADKGANSGLNKTVKKKIKGKKGKDSFEFVFQPRIEMGMANIELRTPVGILRAWVGVNGNNELRYMKKIRQTGTRLQHNYFDQEKRSISSIRQDITDHIDLRLTHDKSHDDQGNITREDNRIRLGFRKRF